MGIWNSSLHVDNVLPDVSTHFSSVLRINVENTVDYYAFIYILPKHQRVDDTLK